MGVTVAAAPAVAVMAPTATVREDRGALVAVRAAAARLRVQGLAVVELPAPSLVPNGAAGAVVGTAAGRRACLAQLMMMVERRLMVQAGLARGNGCPKERQLSSTEMVWGRVVVGVKGRRPGCSTCSNSGRIFRSRRRCSAWCRLAAAISSSREHQLTTVSSSACSSRSSSLSCTSCSSDGSSKEGVGWKLRRQQRQQQLQVWWGTR